MYCPIARALDVLGERWTLLILRELAAGDQRFTDLKRLVVGIPPNVLSNRLKALVDEGVVETRESPPPAARTVYGLTGRGREAMPVLRALARWGIGALDEAGPETPVRPAAVINGAFIPYYDRARGARRRRAVPPGAGRRAVLVQLGTRAAPDGCRGTRPHARRSVVGVHGRPPAYPTLDDLVADGTLQRTKGTVKTQRTFERVFSLR